MVTVDDSCHLLTYEQVDQLADLVSPHVVIPMHYYIDGLTTESSTLMPPDNWLATQRRVRRLNPGPVEISCKDLPDEREVWVFSANIPGRSDRQWAASQDCGGSPDPVRELGPRTVC